MLEEVCIDFLVVRCEVRLHVVVELDDLKLYAFFLKFRLHDLENLGMRNGGGADFDDLLRLRTGIVRAAAAADKGKRCDSEGDGE